MMDRKKLKTKLERQGGSITWKSLNVNPLKESKLWFVDNWVSWNCFGSGVIQHSHCLGKINLGVLLNDKQDGLGKK